MSEEELKKEGYTYICLFCGNNNIPKAIEKWVFIKNRKR